MAAKVTHNRLSPPREGACRDDAYAFTVEYEFHLGMGIQPASVA